MAKCLERRSQLGQAADKQTNEASRYKRICPVYGLEGAGISGETEHAPEKEAATRLEMIATIPKLSSAPVLFCFILSKGTRNVPMFKN